MFRIHRGTNPTFTFTVLDDAGAPVNLTGAKIAFTARDNAGGLILEKKNAALTGGGDAQVEITNAAGGVFKIKLTHADTELEPIFGTCDAFVLTAGGTYYKPVPTQPFEILGAATRALA